MEGFINFIRVNLTDETVEHFNSFEEAGVPNPFAERKAVRKRRTRKCNKKNF